jgi:hypothetical protein
LAGLKVAVSRQVVGPDNSALADVELLGEGRDRITYLCLVVRQIHPLIRRSLSVGKRWTN